jgi:4-alpha-glucanotransferase
MFDDRKSGIFLNPISLPSKYGIGDLGKSAYKFVDFLIRTKQSLWQINPLAETDDTGSPYSSISAFAGNTLLIDLEQLVDEGLLIKHDLSDYASYNFNTQKAEYPEIRKFKNSKLRIAFNNFKPDDEYNKFIEHNKNWLDDYALFRAIKKHFNETYWIKWENKKLIHRDKTELEKYSELLKEDINFFKFTQYVFHKQWLQLKKYANDNNVKIFGDVPIFVSMDSSDVWSNSELFFLDENMQPTIVSGVPPDYFSSTGQLWGNPLYNWEKIENTGFKWWIERLKHIYVLIDYVRIDHFRGFDEYWAVKGDAKTAMKGIWEPAKGRELFETLKNQLGELPIIAEDLGIITDSVRKLRDDFNFPGMKVLHFAFDKPDSEYLPHNYSNTNWIVYTGTHDNNTTIGWYNELCQKDKKNLHFYLKDLNEENVNWKLIEYAMSSVAIFSIFPMQDILGLGSEAKFNAPGTSTGNWAWRFEWNELSKDSEKKLKTLTKYYNRAN